ncbi:MAG: HD domain-containing protein [Blastocatellia bacterium]|nr:HD domain-containing protein [Blastocatellia bacterium]
MKFIESDHQLVRSAEDCDEFECFPAGHSVRLAKRADELAVVFGLSDFDRSVLQQAALIRNVGERIMGRDYIREARILTAEERLDLERHPVIGEQAAAKLGLGRGVQLVVRWHHEYWNGSGYPDRLERNQIPISARLLRVVDTYFSLTNARPFRAAMSDELARKHLVDWAGIEFDPSVVAAFLELPPVETSAEASAERTEEVAV